ncbi:MAG: chemotaxis protein CheR [Kofleriaceae bacterium]|nr:chemotaxis protein CheR [Kofleriaceae bacterium]
MTEPVRVVGIGASAGGLESLERLFAAIPPNTGMAFVVIQHLSPDFKSMMDELIARHTEMPVTMASDGIPLEGDRVYVLPPAKHMIVRGGALLLTDREAAVFSLPIDAFFRSLAHDCGDLAVAVVLSGSGSDGSRGIVEVKRAGGVVLAESVETAKFDGMPQAAIASGVVDSTLSPGELGAAIAELPAREAEPLDPRIATPTSTILGLLHDRFGLDFALYKTTTVARRIQRRLQLSRIASLDEYVERLRNNPDELDKLYRDLLIGVTSFFRDVEAFATLEREVIPKLIANLPIEEELRVWIAGCATGEEAYSIAMLLCDGFDEVKRPRRLKILATDVHAGSIATAAAGSYSFDELAHVSPERLARYFVRRTDGFQIARELRNAVVFARHDVTKDAPFTRMHLITCRNMLIYLEPATYRAVLSLFHFALLPNGYLFLGASESPGSLGEEFAIIDDRWKIYQKRRDLPLVSEVKWASHLRRRKPPTSERRLLEVYDDLLDIYMPPAFLLDEQNRLVDSFGGAERLLRTPARRPTTDILEMLPEDLRVTISSALRRVREERMNASFSNIQIDLDGPAICRVVARPIERSRSVLVTLEAITRANPRAPGAESDGSSMKQAVREHVQGLEDDLKQTREMLATSDDQLSRSVQELEATNEELIASNEELQSTNEELQSLNEELYTVNAENQRQLAELRELTADISHLLEDTDIGTVFLDRELQIRRFTARIVRVFRFQPTDVGRKISDFATTLLRPTLFEELADVLATGRSIADEVRAEDGTLYFLRMLPHRPRRGGIRVDRPEGVILSLTDITALDRARSQAAGPRLQ